MPSEESWAESCIRWRGKILTGKYAHSCIEWDFLPIDETTPEITGCSCYSGADFDQAVEAAFKRDQIRQQERRG